MASLEFTGRVSVYASVVNWLLSSRQSPTVARIAAPVLAVVGQYGCRDSQLGEHVVSSVRAGGSHELMMQVFQEVEMGYTLVEGV